MMKYKISGGLFLLLFSIQTFSQNKAIDEKRYLSIGGIEQWITIKGDDKDKPVVLFLHGGPGSVMSPYSDAIYGNWENEYVLVNWDQRGAGRTYGRNAPKEAGEDYWMENPLTVDQMVRDGIELTEYLIKHLNKQKVILIGTSWGSVLGAKMALARPDLYYAYLGHSQFVNLTENLKNAYQKVYGLAETSGDSITVQKLDTLGEPPYPSAKDTGQLLRIVKKYERDNSMAAPEHWWTLAAEYDNGEDIGNRYKGDDYSFVYFVGHDKLGIRSMVSDIDFAKDGLEFEIPIYLVQGEEDILTASEKNKPYFDKISAPEKQYFLVPKAGHGHNKSVVDTQYKILKEFVTKS
jgi:pimeloyl-ACP methyl ester carboxylesterase